MDDCKTAREVWERVNRISAWRKSLLPAPKRHFIRKIPMQLPTLAPPLPPPPEPEPIGGRSMRTLFVMVAQVCQFSRREMLHHGRGHEVVEARYVAFILMRALYQKSMPEIGRFFLRDHTTIMNGLRLYPRTLAQMQAADHARPLLELVELTMLLMRIEAACDGRRIPQFRK